MRCKIVMSWQRSGFVGGRAIIKLTGVGLDGLCGRVLFFPHIIIGCVFFFSCREMRFFFALVAREAFPLGFCRYLGLLFHPL